LRRIRLTLTAEIDLTADHHIHRFLAYDGSVPTEQDSFSLPGNPDAMLQLCRRVIVERGWSVEEVAAGHITGRVGARPFTWPQMIRLDFEDAEDSTRVLVSAEIGGWGSIQRRALRKNMMALRETLEFEAGQTTG
jgi:hypothetical protein